MKVEIFPGLTATFDENATKPTKLILRSDDKNLIDLTLRRLGDVIDSRGHIFDVEANYPGEIQLALNETFDLDLEISGMTRPKAPRGYQD
jgi:hypothetical protein